MNSTQKARENYEHFAYARDHGHLDFIKKAETCDDYFRGAQWDPRVISRLEARNKPVLTVNKILSTCATIFGEQLQNRADVAFRPSRDGNAETAAALDKLWIHIATTNNLDWIESEVAADGFIRSRGFFDVRIDFDDHMRGEVRITQINSKNVVIDPDAESYDPDGWKEVFITKWLTTDDIERWYGKSAADELRARPHTAYTHAYDSVDWMPDTFGGRDQAWGVMAGEDEPRRRIIRVIERQFKVLKQAEWFVDLRTGDMREVPETWDRDRIAYALQQFGWGVIKRPAEKIHWRTSVDDILLHDAISPYQHFTPVPYFPYFRHGVTLGIVENLISPQDLLNKSISQELHIVNTTANSGWVVKAGALANMTIEELQERGGEDGLVIETNTSPRDIEKIQPNQVPTGIERLSFKADEALKEVSMISDSMRGFDRADVAAKAIQAKQMRGSISLAKPFENLGQTRRLLARNVLDLVQTFYDEERVIPIVGRNLSDQPEELVINQVTPEGSVANDLTIGEYSVVISTVPTRESFEQNQFQEALEMRQIGIAIPDDVLVEHSHLGRKKEIADRIKQLNGGGEPSQAAQMLQQLEMQLKQLEAEEKQADVQVKMSNAQLNAARAQKEQLEAQMGGQNDAELVKMAMEREKMLSQLAADREKAQAEIQLKREELAAEIEFQREKLRAEIQIKQQEAQLKMALQQQQLQMNAEMNAQKLEAERDKMSMQHEMQYEQMQTQHQLQAEKQASDAQLAEKKADSDARIKEKAAQSRSQVSKSRSKES